MKLEEWNLIVLVLQALILLCSLSVLIWQVKKDHLRREREATVKAVDLLMENIRWDDYEIVGGVDQYFPSELLDEFENSPEASELEKAMNLCSRIEHLSAAVKHGVYNFEVLNKMCGMYLIHFYERWHIFMEFRIQFLNSSSTAYDQTEWLIEKLSQVRNLKSPQKLDRINRNRLNKPNSTRVKAA
ncbi:DUF4760 domain-containing protein [Pseudoalteromonas piscicida]|uniref:DUF4760 domain-containing protein n=1 Tax=Pseudoalteromonas piscicida TaxID=43662 RepID=UPI003C7E8FDB